MRPVPNDILKANIENFFMENKEHIKAIEEAISLYSSYNSTMYYCECQICDKKMTEEDYKARTIYDFSVTCLEHRKYAKAFNCDIVRKQLGIAPRKVSESFMNLSEKARRS